MSEQLEIPIKPVAPMMFTVPGLPKMANGSYGSWKGKHARTTKWKQACGWAILATRRVPKVPYQKVRVVFTRCSASEPDYDGLVIGFKAVRDALVEYGVVVDDKSRNMEAEYKWERAKPKEGKIRVEVWPIEG